MKTYKVIHMLKEISEGELKHFSSLFSRKSTNTLNGSDFSYICVPFDPDTYLINDEEIKTYFQNGYYSPLIMTNYKFLSLLLLISNNEKYRFRDFSFREAGEEGDHEKSIIEDMISENRNMKDTFDFLESKHQTIKSIELEFSHPSNLLKIYSSGNISFSNSFSRDYIPDVFNLLKYLFTGKNNFL